MPSIVDLLVKLQVLDDRQHDAVMSRTRSSTGGHIVQQVAEMGYASEGTVARAISVELGLPRIDLALTPPEPQALALLDARTCAERFVLPVALRENSELLWLAMADPTDQETLGVIRRKSGKRVRPAVAGPSEILRAVRTLYSAPQAGKNEPEDVSHENLAAIEIAGGDEEEAFEVVNVGEELGDTTPLSRLAQQLGVAVPARLPSRTAVAAAAAKPKQAVEPEHEIVIEEAAPALVDVRPVRSAAAIPPKTDPRLKLPQPPRALTFDELLSSATRGGPITDDDLDEEDLASLEALGASMEKGALILRALAELCVEKAVFTREEMRKRSR